MTGIRRRGAVAVVAAGGVASSLSGTAAAGVGVLPSPETPLRAVPPFRAQLGGLGSSSEVRYPRSISTRESVRVSVDADGVPVHVTAVQRLLVSGTGDYSLYIPAPADDVVATAGSESQPGLRSGAIVWQGFATRGRLLAAEATLRPRAATLALPLRLVVDRGQLRLVNATKTVTTALVGNVPRRELARQLDLAYFDVLRRPRFSPDYLQVNGATGTAEIGVAVPLSISGTYRFDGDRTRRVRTTLADRPLRLAGSGHLTALDLAVRVPAPATLLRPPRERSWRALAAAGGLRGDTTAFTVRLLLKAALARQFHSFFANPDPRGANQTQYRFVLGRPRPARGEGAAGGGGGPWVSLAVAVGLAIGAVAAVVAWAHA